ncbi:MAG: DUF3379 domain-containing protein [Lentisphaerae bacterium]|nr:DUF3379 domain-containing protein [Lentisphaerota bacterium]
MNICEQTKIRMLEGAALSVEEQKHLETCPDCRSLAAFAKRMEQLPAMEKEVPAYLDEAVLKAASVPVSKPRWKMVLWKVAVPVAATFAFVSGLLFYQSNDDISGQSVSPVKVPVAVKKKTPVQTVASVEVKKEPVINKEPVKTFDEQIFELAEDVGSGMTSFSETMDSVSETMDMMI